MEVKFTVGEMAKLHGITKQMLIFYDREGVFCPKYVDLNNGYRYYTSDQLDVLDSILILRDTGMSLKEIKMHIQSRSGVNALDTLNEQLLAVREKINSLNSVQERLQRKIDSINAYYSGPPSNFIMKCSEDYISTVPVKGAKGLLDLDIALKALLQIATRDKHPHFYQIGGMVSLESMKQGDFFKYEFGFLPLYRFFAADNVLVKPAGLYAHKHHRGPYVELDKTYRSLLDEISVQGYRPVSSSYEFYVLDSLTSQTPDEYITEVQIRIEKK